MCGEFNGTTCVSISLKFRREKNGLRKIDVIVCCGASCVWLLFFISFSFGYIALQCSSIQLANCFGFFSPFLRFCIAFALRCQQTFCSELFGSHFYGKTFNANTQTCVCGWIKCVSENWLTNWNISAQQIVECDENERGKKYEMENFLIAAKPNTNRKENIIRCVNLMCCFVVDFGLVEFAFTN